MIVDHLQSLYTNLIRNKERKSIRTLTEDLCDTWFPVIKENDTVSVANTDLISPNKYPRASIIKLKQRKNKINFLSNFLIGSVAYASLEQS